MMATSTRCRASCSPPWSWRPASPCSTRFRDGPLATAGVVASATGIPPLLFFLTVDVNDLPPYSTEAILYVSTLAWFACWAVGPGKGRPFYLGAALVGFFLSVLQVVEGVFDSPFGLSR